MKLFLENAFLAQTNMLDIPLYKCYILTATEDGSERARWKWRFPLRKATGRLLAEKIVLSLKRVRSENVIRVTESRRFLKDA